MHSLKALAGAAVPTAALLARPLLRPHTSRTVAVAVAAHQQLRTHASAAPSPPTTDHLLAPLSPWSPRSAAICFDIDGVLIQGGRVLPEARRALALVNGDNARNVLVPHLYLTNGGGVTEEEKAHQLAEKFGVPVRPDQVVLSHTPMRELAHKYKDEWVLAVGARGTNAQRVLRAYGFNKLVTPYQVYRWDKTVAPFCVAPDAVVAEHEPVLALEKVNFGAVLVVHDSRDWGTDLQIMCDVLRSPAGNLGAAFHGHARPAASTPGSRPTMDPELLAAINRQHVPLYWSNPDLLWANEYPVPRFGQRGLRVALKAMWKEMTGTDLVYTSYGKPETNTYKYAFATLHRMFHDGREPAHPLDQQTIANCVNDHFEVYAVGDNPLADIEGAHRHGWHGLLVRTGVYQSGQPLTVPTTKVLDNVEEAVKFVWERHYGEQQ